MEREVAGVEQRDDERQRETRRRYRGCVRSLTQKKALAAQFDRVLAAYNRGLKKTGIWMNAGRQPPNGLTPLILVEREGLGLQFLRRFLVLGLKFLQLGRERLHAFAGARWRCSAAAR